MFDTSILDTSILAIAGISSSIPLVSILFIFMASPSMSTIVSIPGTQVISARTVETKHQLSTKFLGKGK